MGDTLKVYGFGSEGVNLVTDPLKLKDTECTQLQNAEILNNEATAGLLALSSRGGLAPLNGSSAMSGSVIGIQGWPLLTTTTRTLYAALQTAENDSTAGDTWLSTTNGTSWTEVSTPTQAAVETKYADEGDNFAARRMLAYRESVLFPGNEYTQDTDDPEIIIFDGTNNFIIPVRPGPSGNGNPAFAIVDMLMHSGRMYVAMHEPGGTAPDNAGRVLELDLDTGSIQQIATGMAATSSVPSVTGGAPACMTYYKGQLFVGLNHENTTADIGKIVRCVPGIATTWTTDVSNLDGSITSLGVYKGRLFACTKSSASETSRIYARSATAGTYSVVHSGTGAGQNAYITSFHVHSGTGSAYAVEYDEGGDSDATIVHILVSTDGTTWSTSRDVDANDITGDSSVATNKPGQMVSFNNGTTDDLYVAFRATSPTAADGFIMRLSGGTWTKVVSGANIGGFMSVLTQRSI